MRKAGHLANEKHVAYRKDGKVMLFRAGVRLVAGAQSLDRGQGRLALDGAELWEVWGTV